MYQRLVESALPFCAETDHCASLIFGAICLEMRVKERPIKYIFSAQVSPRYGT